MEQFELIAPCHFGVESVLKREIQNLGYEILETEDGRVTFRTDAAGIPRANLFLRTPERILLKCGSFHAETFDELYEGIREIPWERYLPRDARFWVTKATTNRSRIFSATAIQSVAKKAMVERMGQTYHILRFAEDGADYPVRIFIRKDQVTVGIDTTGTALHKRGYRTLVGKAPIAENLAAALLMLTPWHPDRILADPFCGSGTFLIEAAMMAAGIAPGMKRDFLSENWRKIIPTELWKEAREEAASMVRHPADLKLQGYDIDGEIVECARKNAEAAGVGEYIHFQQRDVKDFSSPRSYGFLVTNPPYGERLADRDSVEKLYRELGEVYRRLDKWSLFVVTSYEGVEKAIGRKADRNRKIYNGMIRAYFYQFMGPKPEKKRKN